ncbi:MAG: protein YgfX [Pseudomonadales bacterium]
MPASLNVQVKPSRYLLALLLTIMLMGGVCVCLSALPSALLLATLVFVGVISASALRHHYFLGANDSIHGLNYRQEQWYLQLRDAEVAATLLPTSTLTNSLLVLNFLIDDSSKKANLILLPDSTTADSLRQLKAVLRFTPALANPRRNNSAA